MKEKLKQISIKKFLETKYNCEFKRIGRSWFCLSPLRAENNPSFSVNQDETLWYDFGIGEGGDIFKLVQQLENCSFAEAIKILQDFDGYKIENSKNTHQSEKENKDVSSFYKKLIQHTNQLLVRRFFKEMNLPFYAEAGIAEYKDIKGQRYIVIPCPNRHNIKGLECIGITTENGKVTISTNQGKKVRKTLGKKYPWILYRSDKALVTESIIDCLAGEAIYGNGFTLIALNGVGNVKFLSEVIRTYQLKQILLALDNDEAGKQATKKAIELIPSNIEIRIIKDHIKNETKDLYQYFIKTNTKRR